MSIKIVADSSCDLNEDLQKQVKVKLAPLKLQLKDKVYVDDENLDVKAFLKDMHENAISPKTACPSPEDFMKCYEGNEDVFVVTISAELSGTYNSAVLAKNIYQEEHKDQFIHIFNSRSASAGETLITLKINDLLKTGLNKDEMIAEIEKYISEMKTLFLIESLDHLSKAGRINPIIAKAASLLSIKPIMGATPEGTIKLFHKVRGYNKAFQKLVDTIGELKYKFERIVIAHCNCLDRALELKKAVENNYQFKEIVVVEMGGLSSSYSDQGGLVIAF
ncbi:MAG: putative DegV family protein [Haloplasmataceae bacterium]|jgi:DegV family protein with EDD domain|nr:putative DegV family protein [Haloplasmataceae bacterium]